MKIKLPNGEKAEVIKEVTNDLCGYVSNEFPTGSYENYDLYINLMEGLLYALEKSKE